jgi:hypothetical protein
VKPPGKLSSWRVAAGYSPPDTRTMGNFGTGGMYLSGGWAVNEKVITITLSITSVYFE